MHFILKMGLKSTKYFKDVRSEVKTVAKTSNAESRVVFDIEGIYD